MNAQSVKVIIDYDGTLTYEERYVADLAKKAVKDLAENILQVSPKKLEQLYQKTKEKILKHPEQYSWVVNSLPACYACEGALLMNTVTTQTLLKESRHFTQKVKKFFKEFDYDPIVDCTNYLFHKHTFDLDPHFREEAREILLGFIKKEGIEPYILTCSKGDKVTRNLQRLKIGTWGNSDRFKDKIKIFGDTRQYEMDPDWDYYFEHPRFGRVQTIKVNDQYSIDLRRSDYFNKLKEQLKDGAKVIIAADMVSLPGILPLLMGIDFIMLRASYTPQWSVDFVQSFSNGWVINRLGELPAVVDKIMRKWFLKNEL